MRSTGLSDRHTPLPDLETQARDVLTVLDAVGSYSTVLFSDDNLVAPFFAATHPRRTRALCFFDPEARWVQTEDYPWGETPEEAARELVDLEYTWGRDAHAASLISRTAPTLRGDRDLVRWYARMARHWVAPGDAVELLRRLNHTDVRDILPTINVPTACIVRRFEGGIDQAEDVARQIPGARLIVLEGSERWSAGGNQVALVDAIREFVGVSHSVDSGLRLRTILFTDIVGSTSIASSLGDVRWQALLTRHHGAVREELSRFDGHEEDTAGDGFFATFDGPARAIRCAQAIIGAVKPLGLEIRAGVHTGEVQTIEGSTPGGIAVHLGARVASLAGPSEVLVSRTVKDLIAGSGVALEDAGEHELRGVSDRWRLYRVLSASA
jgi:class 3 adenylate cyclase